MVKEIPEEKRKILISQYEAIRRSGLSNMFYSLSVQRIAYDNDFYELVNAIEDKQYTYILTNYSQLMKLITEDDIPAMA